MSEILNAKVTGTSIESEDHGILTCWLFLEGGGWGCGFGGYTLDDYDTSLKCRVATSAGFEAIRKIMDTLEVNRWEDIAGNYIRCEFEKGLSGGITRIGHILKNKWFSFDEHFEAARAKRKIKEE